MKRESEVVNAATVILIRPRNSAEFEVFLTRRPAGMNVLAGIYVFPGGTITKEDYADRMLRRCCGISQSEARKLLGAHLSPKLALGHWVAAIRELFEESGVLLAAHREGEPLELGDIDIKARFTRKRTALLKREIDFQTLLESEKLFCDTSKLSYFSHWRTPAQFPDRFDTRFFLARLPEDQTRLATSAEVAHSVWLTPDRALELFERDELPMIFPTFASLRTLADFDSVESLFRQYDVGRET